MNKEISESNNIFCIMPFIHFHMNTSGYVHPCCISHTENDSNSFGNINKHSMKQIWNGESIKKFRVKMLSGIPDSRCEVCYNNEKFNNKSLRQYSNQEWKSELPVILKNTSNDGSYNKYPIYYDIRFSNVCNMKCRTCWHGASSKWFSDARAIHRNVSDVPIIEINNKEKFFSDLEEFLPHVREIYFAGGEPLIMDEHYQILRWFDAHRLYPKLRYNTNFMNLNYKKENLLNLWSKFSDVEVSASFDGYGKRAELLRSGTNWIEICKNVKAIKNTNVKFRINYTVSLLNILSLIDFHKYCKKENIINHTEELSPFIFCNILHYPKFFSVKCLPFDIKIQLKKEFEQFYIELNSYKNGNNNKKIDDQISEYQSLVNYIFTEDLSGLLPEAKKEIQLLDSLRKESTFDIFPELKCIL